MGIRIVSTFESYNLGEREKTQAAILSPLQKQYLHNLRTDAALEKLSLTFLPENLGRDAELQGQIGILTTLLQASIDAETQLSDQTQPQDE
jgi:hypothetical protein